MQTLEPTVTQQRDRFTVTAGSHRILLGKHTKIMGIINLTPDSFSRDGCMRHTQSMQRAIIIARRQIQKGADLLDIGGESTRPGARPIEAKEELNRILPTIKFLTKKFKLPISVDTYKPEVARAALDAGVSIINTVMGANPDIDLLKMVKNYNAAIILMHMHKTPPTMQNNIRYHNLIGDITHALKKSIEKCLEIGIKLDKIIVDPGIGFGKTVAHNLRIINRFGEFKTLKRPLLIGTSRKSFIGTVLNKDIDKRLLGTAATVSAAIINGAHIVRVHDVEAIKETVTMTDAIINEQCLNPSL